MTATSMASWVSAPQVAGSHPTAATPMASRESPMPATTLWVAMARERRAMTTASPSRSSRSTVRTTSAASDEAVAPRAPMATPTSARARAGASLMPSPTMMVGADRRASCDGVDLLGRCPLGEDLVDADHGADGLGDLGPIAGDHHDAVDAVARAGGGCVRAASGRMGSSRSRAPAGWPSTATKTLIMPVPVGSAANRPQPREVVRDHPARPCRPQRHARRPGLAPRDRAPPRRSEAG